MSVRILVGKSAVCLVGRLDWSVGWLVVVVGLIG